MLMSNYSYVAVDPRGGEKRGVLEVADQAEALRRIKEMGLYPTRVLAGSRAGRVEGARGRVAPRGGPQRARFGLGGRVKPTALVVFTRQLATLIEAGMPLLRGLRTLEQQAEDRVLKRVLCRVSHAVESGASFTEAIAGHPRVFSPLYVNMVRAGEIAGALETTLQRLCEFMEKAQRIKNRVKAAMFYPCAVLLVATGVLILLMTFVVPRFKLIFDGLLNGGALPPFTMFVFRLSEFVRHNLTGLAIALGACGLLLSLLLKTEWGRWMLDHLKLSLPIVGPLFRKVAIARLSRTLGTLVASGVPILQALTIARETAGNRLFGRVVGQVHEQVKQGEPMAPALKASRLFPVIVSGMVDVGEQTGALPEMLRKIADNYDEEVDNAASALTSLLEPVMIVVLAVIVGGIVIAMFMPLTRFPGDFADATGGGRE